MGTVIADLSMSLDGFVAEPDDRIDRLTRWLLDGDVAVPTANPAVTFRTSEASAAELRDSLDDVGALIVGRRRFDLAGGWGGAHPMGVPVFVVTHSVPDGWDDAPFTFVTDGIESALDRAKAVAGERVVGIASPSLAQQYLDAGLLDGLRVSLVPVVLGTGIRLFDNLSATPVELEGPLITEGDRVTHLAYRVRGNGARG